MSKRELEVKEVAFNLIGPVVVEKGELRVICFWEGADDLVQFIAVGAERCKPAFREGDTVVTPDGSREVERLEVFQLSMPHIVSLWQGSLAYSASGWQGFTYHLKE